ncbi:MAG: peptidoglycan editing factor PgeF [Gammaproteobacteria bacterium]|nr:peptidoglycan editing factor PgeF [Gammaproteobacteria bacterium]
MTSIECLYPDWPAPVHVKAFTTTRLAGFSRGSYAGLNLASHVKDNRADVDNNRQLVMDQLSLPAEPAWLNQVHGIEVVDAARITLPVTADASCTDQGGVICAVLTADCLPVLICNDQGTKVAAIHAGWRGLQAGIIEATVKFMQEPAENLHVWLGPAIGPDAFEVGEEVRQAFVSEMPETESAFRFHRQGHYLADIYQIARIRLQKINISSVSGGNFCTYTDSARFYSYRRDGDTGRMATLIWMEA